MAELQAGSSGLGPAKQRGNLRHLLPFEAQLCELLEITPEEYFYFESLSQAYNGKRKEGYELVPAVNNDVVSAIVALVVGVAFTAASAALAPKSAEFAQEEEEEAPSLATENNEGASRYSSLAGFDSVQSLAALGEVVQLVFANRRNSIGGVRANAQLLWSQMLSNGKQQSMLALTLLSAGPISTRPDYAGYAIGDQLVHGYVSKRIGLYYKNGDGRVSITNDRYPETQLSQRSSDYANWDDLISVYTESEVWEPWFCGTRSSSTSTEFGCYQPMPSAQPYRLPYELVIVPRKDGTDEQLRADADTKKAKVGRDYPTWAGVIAQYDDHLVYYIRTSMEAEGDYAPWGLSDVNSATEAIRVTADDQLNKGGLYMYGGAQLVAVDSSPNEVWSKELEKSYTLQIEKDGYIELHPDLGSTSNIFTYSPTLQALAIGQVSNNRVCDATEIGLKSTVWKQISGFPNVNSQPDGNTLYEYEQKNGSITLGSITRYVHRCSFFRLEIRPLGSDDDNAWYDISNNTYFCIRNNTPSPLYNFLRIYHPKQQWEFQLVPVSGSEALRTKLYQDVWVLGGENRHGYTVDQFSVVFNGYLDNMTVAFTTNPEWTVGHTPAYTGVVTAISPTSLGPPRPGRWEYVSETVEVRDTRYEVDASGICPENKQNVWIEYVGANSCGVPNGNHRAYWDGQDQTATTSTYYKGAERDRYERSGLVRWIAYEIYTVSYESGPGEWKWIEDPPFFDANAPATGTGSGLLIRLTGWTNGHWEYTLVEGGTGYTNGEQVLCWDGTWIHAMTVTTDENNAANDTLNVHDAAVDWYKYDAESSSHTSGPEHSIVYINEMVRQSAPGPQYEGLVKVGVEMLSGYEWSNFSQFSAYMKRGVEIERLIDDSGNPLAAGALTASSNNIAEIAYALLTNTEWGAGKYVGAAGVDRDRMQLAARYCHANGFTWDGVIGDAVNLRSFLFDQAAYALLDFTIVGGRFSLVPSCAYDSNFVIDENKAVEIKALFTDGNIKDLSVTWRSAEERRLFRAVVLYRTEYENGFPEPRVISVRLNDAEGGSDNDPEKAFDLSQFCTQRDHALKFAKFALRLQQKIDHSVSFTTTPAAALNLAPGEHFRLVSEATHTSRFANGVITPDGLVVSAEGLADGQHTILFWEPGTTDVQEAIVTVAGNKVADDRFHGVVYTVKNEVTTSRVYKVESLSVGEDGFVEVSASYEPVFGGFNMQTLSWADSYFVIEEG